MKAVIFAGGVGTRLWPLSRRESPKQFGKVISDKSTLQLSVERLLPDFNWQDIYIASSEKYFSLIRRLLPDLPITNLILEPETRDVGPAVGLATAYLFKKYPDIPLVILWSDHLIKQQERFKQILHISEEIISKNKNRMIFIGQKPRFASQNLGWIKYGEEIIKKKGVKFYSFEEFHYHPDLKKASEFLKNGHYTWNLGYFVTTSSFLWRLFEKHQPEIFDGMKKISKFVDKPNFRKIVKEIYPKLPRISFDDAILVKINKEDALVVSDDLGWSDVGAWEALKEALQTSPEQNVIKGKVSVTDCRDSLVYNYTNQLVVAIDLDGFLVIDTHDVVLVCHKNSVPKIKKLVERLAGTEDRHLI